MSKMPDAWGHLAPFVVALKYLCSEYGKGAGAFHLSCPTGGWAYGIPRNETLLVPKIPSKVPISVDNFTKLCCSEQFAMPNNKKENTSHCQRRFRTWSSIRPSVCPTTTKMAQRERDSCLVSPAALYQEKKKNRRQSG